MAPIVMRGQLTPAPGREDELAAVLAELVAIVRENDTGTLNYGYYRDERSGRYVVIEEYESVAAMRAHFANIVPLLPRLADLLIRGEHPLEIFAARSDELDEVFGVFNPVYLPPVFDIHAT
jgi:quinol monooxygenase YgiN